MHWGFVIAGYVVVVGSVAVYATWLLARGRSLSADVPEQRRRFLD